MVFISKVGKVSHIALKGFRPISLPSFLIKTLEKLIDAHLRATKDIRLLSGAQHECSKCGSTAIALHELVGYIKKLLDFKVYTMVAHLNIGSDFNNITPNVRDYALSTLRVEVDLKGLMHMMLTSRRVTAELGASISTR